MVRSKRAALLIDPLLVEEFGGLHAMGYRVYPPRVVTPAEFPKISALVLTHEHDDHFYIPSLARLDRKIPVYLSTHSSTAAKRILAEMGFNVSPLVPGVPLRVEDLEFIPFTGDHTSVNCSDEWDALPFMVRHTGGAGSLFSMVDITITPQHVEWARAREKKPGIVTWTNNAIDWSHMAHYLSERTEGTEQCFAKMGTGHKMLTTLWGTPAAMLMCAGGFAFHGDRAWLNERVFCVDTDIVCKKMTAIYPKERFYSTLPGQTFWMESNRIQKVDATTSFLHTAPADAWPSRARANTAQRDAPDFAPATGRRAFSDDDRTRLEALLRELASALVGGALFRSLHSLLATEVGDRKATFALVLRREEGEPLVYEYAPTACAFVPGRGDAKSTVLAGIQTWASDMLAVLGGDMGPIALTFSRARLWNTLPQRFDFPIFEELYRVSHPLRRPDDYLRAYRAIWQKNADVTPAFSAA